MSKRDIIFKAGVDEISTRGFFNTRVSDIVNAANLSIGTFYNYFDDKNDFLFSIYLDIGTRLYNELKDISYMKVSELDKVIMYFEALFKESSINTNLVKVCIAEKHYLCKILDEEKLNILYTINYNIDILLETIILDGIRKKIIKEIEPNIIIVMIESLIKAELFQDESREKEKDTTLSVEEKKLFILDAIKL